MCADVHVLSILSCPCKPNRLFSKPPSTEVTMYHNTYNSDYNCILYCYALEHCTMTLECCVAAKTPLDQARWGPNVEEFRRRFDPDMTWGEGPKRLKNLYFTYLVELRALAKAAPYLEQV